MWMAANISLRFAVTPAEHKKIVMKLDGGEGTLFGDETLDRAGAA